MAAQSEQADAELQRSATDCAEMLIRCALCGHSVPAASLAAHGQRCFERLQQANGGEESKGDAEAAVETADERKEGPAAITSSDPASESPPPLSPPLLPPPLHSAALQFRGRRAEMPAAGHPGGEIVSMRWRQPQQGASRPNQPIRLADGSGEQRPDQRAESGHRSAARLPHFFLLVLSHAAEMHNQLER